MGQRVVYQSTSYLSPYRTHSTSGRARSTRLHVHLCVTEASVHNPAISVVCYTCPTYCKMTAIELENIVFPAIVSLLSALQLGKYSINFIPDALRSDCV